MEEDFFVGTGIIRPPEPTWRDAYRGATLSRSRRAPGPPLAFDFSPPPEISATDIVLEHMEMVGRDLGRAFAATLRNWRYEGRHGRQWTRLHPAGADRLDPERLPAWMGWLD